MNAGRELDRLIGERLMGLHVIEQDGDHYLVDSNERKHGMPWMAAERAWVECPSYSTNIGWAWQVVERIERQIRSDGQHVAIICRADDYLAAIYRAPDVEALLAESGSTVAEAVCRLALNLWDVEVSA